MKKLVVMLVLLLAFGTALAGNIYYVSPDGKTEAEGGEGTLAKPYELFTALKKVTSCQWDEVRFLFGTYALTNKITMYQSCKYLGWNGETDQPAGADRRRVVIDGQNTVNGFYAGNLQYYITVADMTITNTAAKAFDVTNSAYTQVTNCIFTGTHGVAVSGNGIYGNALTYVDCDFTENYGTGWNILGQFSNLCVVRNCRFYNNHQTTATGAYGSLLELGDCTMEDCVFTNNTGVGHSLFNTPATFRHCLFADNTNTTESACLYLADGYTTPFYDCTFRNNCGKNGGCFTTGSISGYSQGGVLWATNCTFIGNTATGSGGVQVFQSTGVDGKEDPTIGRTNIYVDCVFKSNLAGSNGGVLSSSSKWPRHGAWFEKCTFTDNMASNTAGVIANGYKAGFCVLTNCSFTGNRAITAGGVLTGSSSVVSGLQYVVACCGFTNNVARSGGVGYYTEGTFRNCDFVGNVATNDVANSYPTGGAFYLFGGSMWEADSQTALPLASTFERCNFIDNESTQYGAPVIYQKAEQRNRSDNKTPFWYTNVTFHAKHCVFKGNRNRALYNFDKGGGVITLQGLKDFDITDCSFIENDSYGFASAIQIWPNTAGSILTNGLIRNCLFYGNRCLGDYGNQAASACYLNESNTVVDACSFVANETPKGWAGALYLGTEVPVSNRVVNTLFYANTANGSGQPEIETTANNLARAFSHCFETNGILSGPGCIGAGRDPRFVDYQKGDCRLTNTSPCVNAGTNETWMVGAKDLQEHKRISRIMEDIVDIGCYELLRKRGLRIIFR